MGADGVQRVGRVAADHVEVQVQRDRGLGDRRIGHERSRAVEAGLLGIERGDHDRVKGLVTRERGRGRDERGDARGVVVRAVEHLAVADPEVIVVRRHHDRVITILGARNESDQIDAAAVGPPTLNVNGRSYPSPMAWTPASRNRPMM